jgi:hypothetical protein
MTDLCKPSRGTYEGSYQKEAGTLYDMRDLSQSSYLSFLTGRENSFMLWEV